MNGLAAVAIDETDAEWATRLSLREYRLQRKRNEPYSAAVTVTDDAARYLANVMLADEPTGSVRLAVARCRAARAIYDTVSKRCDVGGKRKFHELTLTEQFWSTGKLAGVQP